MSKYFHTSARLSVCNRNRSWGIPIRIGLDWSCDMGETCVHWSGSRFFVRSLHLSRPIKKKNEIIIIIMIMVVTHTRTETSLNYGKGRTAFQTQTKSFVSSFREVQTEGPTLPTIRKLTQYQFETNGTLTDFKRKT